MNKLRQEIFKKIKEYYCASGALKPFVPGKTKIYYAGRVYDHKEMINLTESALDFWLTAGVFSEKLEKKFKEYFEAKDFLLVNSGSSANLLIISALTSPMLTKRLKKGDEIITPAVTFPTTVGPIIQNGLVPVFVDSEIATYNINCGLIKKAVSKKTKAIFIPHNLGNPCDMDEIMDVARKNNLFVLEDSCDALGARFNGQKVGTFGDMASLSFYAAHHMTMGEGGGVIINNPVFRRIALSLRDWGRDCWCKTGESNTCKKRFSFKKGQLPYGYDHKYIYSQLGFNLKATDMQAAIGLAQFEKLPSFIEARNKNFDYYNKNLKQFEDFIILPRSIPKSEPSWFGFPITVKNGINRLELTQWLESSGIETRLLFAGNITRQPALKNTKYRVSGSLKDSDRMMNNAFFIGVYPGLTHPMREFVIKSFGDFFKRKL